MRVFNTYLYEISKGTKPAALVTLEISNLDIIKKKLKDKGFDFIVQELQDSKVNVFFGKKECMDAIRAFLKPLSKLNPYEDFILGTILGYSPCVQCKRFISKISS